MTEWYEGVETDEELEMAFMETWFIPKEQRSKEANMLELIQRIMERELSDQALRLIRIQANKILQNREALRIDKNYYG